MLKFVRAKVIGSDWVTVLQPTKKEAKVLKDKAVPVGVIYYIDEDLERTTLYYQVGSNPIAVQIQGISRCQAKGIMEYASDYYVHGYIDSGTIFPNEEVLIRTELINYGLYRLEEDLEEDTSEDEEDTLEDCDDDLEEDTSEDEEDTSEDEEDTSEDEEDTSEDYIETTNVCGVEIKNHCIPFSETMLVHEAVEKELTDFLGDLNLERRELFDTDIDCTLSLNEQYNNMVTGFIMFGAVLRTFTFDVKYSRDYYLGYIARSYNLSKWEIKELANLIDIGINLDSSVIEPNSFTLRNCLKSFINTVYSCICFESNSLLYLVQVVEKLQTEDWFYRAAKFYLTMVCWGKFKQASFIDDDCDIGDCDYYMEIKNYNANLELFERDDMYDLLTKVAKEFDLNADLVEIRADEGIISKGMAVYILQKWYNYKKNRYHIIPDKVQTELLILRHVIRKIKGVH